MLKGLRVVRGPDWKWGDQDGGMGCTGTVVAPKSLKKSSDGMVCWDSGTTANYRISDGDFDLRIYDNAPLGVKHPNVICDSCDQTGILGIRWKCRKCDDYDLCHSCYHGDKHNLQHPFSRIDTTNAPGVDVPRRDGVSKFKALGLFPGARVMRGPDWKYDDQDGGKGSVGAVIELHSEDDTYRSWVRVKWSNGTKNLYRCGEDGKMEVKYKEKETNGQFYIEHLPVFDGTKVRPYVDAGNKVRLLEMELSTLKELQLKRCGWNDDIASFKGKVGEVIVVDIDGDIKVNFGGSSFFVNPLCLMLEKGQQAESAELEVEDLNGLLALLVKAHLSSALQGLVAGQSSPRGTGVALYNAAVEGNLGKVREIIQNNPDAVTFQRDGTGQTALMIAAHEGHTEIVKVLVKGNAPLEVKDNDGDTALACAVFGHEPSIAKVLLDSGCNINTTNIKGSTPLHIATAGGDSSCTEVLLNHEGCDVNCKTNEGHTPLFVAIVKNDQRTIKVMVQHPRVDLKMQDEKGFNSLHFAVMNHNQYAIERILHTAPAMLNLQKDDGFTALHIAALNNLTQLVMTLVKRSDCEKDIKTIMGQTALHLAVDKCHNKCIEALVNNGANVNAQDKDGDTSLHLVMIKASMKDILGITPMGKLLELIQEAKSEGDSTDAKKNLIAIAIYLIQNDANIYIKNKKGQDVLDVYQSSR